MGRNRILKEIRHFVCRHGGIDIRKVRQHLPSPAVKLIQGHQIIRIIQNTLIFPIQPHDGEEFVFGIEGTKIVLQLGKCLYGRRPYNRCMLLFEQMHQFVLEYNTGTMRGQHQCGAAQLLPIDLCEDGACYLLQETIHVSVSIYSPVQTINTHARDRIPSVGAPPYIRVPAWYSDHSNDRTYNRVQSPHASAD